MECVDLETTKAKRVNLLTQADKVAQLESLFTKYQPKTDVFLPSSTFYAPLSGPEDVELMANEIFKWLGVKHRSLEIHVNVEQIELVRYNKQGASSSLSLGLLCLKDSFLCGAVVAHGIVHHLLLARSKVVLGNSEENEELTDLGTIYAGLGVLLLNSFGAKQDALGSMARANYLAECLDYFESRSVVASIWQPYVLPTVAKQQLNIELPEDRYATYIRSDLQKHSIHKKRLIALTVAIVIGIGLISFMVINRPKYLSAEMQAKKDDIAILRSQYKQCADTVNRKLQTWDQTDIFIQRQIEADQSRCTSLRNRYNYEVGEFNSKL